MSEFSCHGCTARAAGCHATCETYKKEKAAHEAKKAQENMKKTADSYMYDTIHKTRKNILFECFFFPILFLPDL
jgi:hypothetical protein